LSRLLNEFMVKIKRDAGYRMQDAGYRMQAFLLLSPEF